MCKFSIIVPVFNTEKYLDRCLKSLLNQEFDDYEIIIINDGSFDNSANVIEKYLSNSKIKLINQENKGLSEARNNGIKISSGDYLILVDSDDFVSNNLLIKLNNILEKDYDLIKIQYANYDGNINNMIDKIEMNKVYSNEEYFNQRLETKDPFEMAWLYVYNRKFWLDNNFKYSSGAYHEDFGLTPLIILNAKSIFVSDIIGYFYNQEGISITRNSNYKKTIKKAYDMLKHFDYLYENVNKLELNSKTQKYFNSYLANGVINKINTLNKVDKKKYILELKKRKIFDLVIDDTLIRKIKKLIIKIKY